MVVLFSLGSTAVTASSALAQRSASNWMPARIFDGRTGHAMAFDDARQRVVSFGGADTDGSIHGDTWEWDGTRWNQAQPTVSPPPREDHAMAYDRARQRIVMFGGYVGELRYSSETWVWDGIDWQKMNTTLQPSPRSRAAMAYDEATQRVLLFGGIDDRGFALGDAWLWDGATWQVVAAAGAPSARSLHAMASDVARQSVVVFGGFDAAFQMLSDTWEWSGGAWRLIPTSTAPPARAAHALAFDSASSHLLLFGGWDASFAAHGDTWSWDGRSWTQRSPALSPAARSGHAMVTGGARGRLVAFGGFSRTSYTTFSDTWEWDGNQWLRIQPEAHPSRRQDHAMAYDAARGRVVLFGGQQDGNGTSFQDTWEWDGAAWQEMRPLVKPSARSGHAMVYDAIRRRVVLFGGDGANASTGYFNDTWEWDGVIWAQVPTPTRPSPRTHHAMAYDSIRRRAVLFGGYDLQTYFRDTWEWDGMQWRLLQPVASPPLAWYGAAAFDEQRGKTVFYATGPETWEWDGSTWTVLSGGVGTPYGSAMTFDAVRGRVVRFGGARCFRGGHCGNYSETWEWDGANWQTVPTASAPEGRVHAVAVFDARAQRVVLFGGGLAVSSGSWTPYADTHLFGSLAPASVLRFGYACAPSGSPPVLTSDAPHLGNAGCRLDVNFAPPSAPCVLGFSPSSISYPIGGNCTMHLSLPITTDLVQTNAFGFASASHAVPFEPSLRNVVVYAQAFILDPATSPPRLSATNGLRLAVGD